MSTLGIIGINLDLLQQNISRMLEQAAVLPPVSEVVRTEGARDEDGQRLVNNRLMDVARQVAWRTEMVRTYVERNAAAFEAAAAGLQETDGQSSLAARQADAFVDGIVTTSPASSSNAPSTTPTPSAPATSPGADNDAW